MESTRSSGGSVGTSSSGGRNWVRDSDASSVCSGGSGASGWGEWGAKGTLSGGDEEEESGVVYRIGDGPGDDFLDPRRPEPAGVHLTIDRDDASQVIVNVLLPGFTLDNITVAMRRGHKVHVVADSYGPNGGHFEKLISLGSAVSSAAPRAEFNGSLLSVYIQKRLPSKPVQLFPSSSAQPQIDPSTRRHSSTETSGEDLIHQGSFLSGSVSEEVVMQSSGVSGFSGHRLSHNSSHHRHVLARRLSDLGPQVQDENGQLAHEDPDTTSCWSGSGSNSTTDDDEDLLETSERGSFRRSSAPLGTSSTSNRSLPPANLLIVPNLSSSSLSSLSSSSSASLSPISPYFPTHSLPARGSSLQPGSIPAPRTTGPEGAKLAARQAREEARLRAMQAAKEMGIVTSSRGAGGRNSVILDKQIAKVAIEEVQSRLNGTIISNPGPTSFPGKLPERNRTITQRTVLAIATSSSHPTDLSTSLPNTPLNPYLPHSSPSTHSGPTSVPLVLSTSEPLTRLSSPASPASPARPHFTDWNARNLTLRPVDSTFLEAAIGSAEGDEGNVTTPRGERKELEFTTSPTSS